MADICYNHLRIWGKDTEAFMEAAASTDQDHAMPFDPNTIRPTPEELLGIPTNEKLPAKKQKALVEKYGHKDWWEWRRENWGTRLVYDSDGEWTPLKKHGAKMWSLKKQSSS
jgi:hypothetical protein